MPEKRTIERAKRDRREGKAPSTQAGEFVREERKKAGRDVQAGRKGRRPSTRRSEAA